MPHEDYHACELNISLDVVGSQKRTHNGKQYTARIGKTKTGSAEHSYLYPNETWTTEQARNHCKGHGGKFIAATKKIQEYLNPETNPLIKVNK